MTRWLDPPPVDIQSLSSLALDPLVAQTLNRRGLNSPELAGPFLNPGSYSPTPPSALPDLDKAVHRINQAITHGERICIWGDFDVDGQTSTSLLAQTLSALGSNITFHIPNRRIEGHGVNIPGVKAEIADGVQLIITCDTGITSYEALDYSFSRGVDVIVTDHHELGEQPANAFAVVNPRMLPDDHPLATLSGVGVAYKLAEGLLDPHSRADGDRSILPTNDLQPEELLDLVALGLIADVAVLRKDARFLTQMGIQQLRKTKRLGLTALSELSETDLESITEETIGFVFAPRLNALGRLGDASLAVELLLTRDSSRANVLAVQIEGLNSQRKLLTRQVYEAAQAQLRENPDLLTNPAIVLSHANWPGGVVGIVANKLVEDYHKAVILLTKSDDGVWRGSGRSVEGIHITEAIKANSKYLLGFGGHPMAAGLSLASDQIPFFKQGFYKSVERMLGEEAKEEPSLQLDAWISLPSVSLDLAATLEQMAPFGAGNPPVILATSGLFLKSASEIGRAKEHRRLVVSDQNGVKQDILWWGGATRLIPEWLERPGSRFDLAYAVRSRTYRGERGIALEFIDARLVEEASVVVSRRSPEIHDLRSRSEMIASLPPGTLIWAEGPHKNKGKDRSHLHQSDEFAIWTSPPSLADLSEALEIVQPVRIYLFAAAPPLQGPQTYLGILAGMVKLIINRRSGKVRLMDLAVATAETKMTIRLGLEWLVAAGQLNIVGDNGDLLLTRKNNLPQRSLQHELYLALTGSLEESLAYRRFFGEADPNSIFQK